MFLQIEVLASSGLRKIETRVTSGLEKPTQCSELVIEAVQENNVLLFLCLFEK